MDGTIDRRSLMTAAAAASLATSAGAARVRGRGPIVPRDARAAGPKLPSALVGAEAERGYFTEARLHETLGTADLRRPTDVTVVAYNFPSWHASPWMEQRFGTGWTEYDTLRAAKPLFPGHTMPRYPLWGYYDESDPLWAAREIDLAADHGIDAWLVDWYWHNGTQFYHEQLERGFLKATNRDRLKFAVMWANHDWRDVYPGPSPDLSRIILPQLHSIADCERVIDYVAAHYFGQPNYLTIDGAPLFAIFDFGKFAEQLGIAEVPRALDLMRSRALKLGYPKLHLQVCNGYDKVQGRLKELGFDSAAQYGTFAWTYDAKRVRSRLPYGVGCVEAIPSWREKQRSTNIPFYPCVSVGWDDSPRFGEFASVAINRSPDQFERLMRAARHTVAGDTHAKHIYIAAWNEWTEDHVLLPDSTWGYGYVEALKRAVG